MAAFFLQAETPSDGDPADAASRAVAPDAGRRSLLFIWMIVPLALTIYFSTLHYSLLDPGSEAFVGLENYPLLPHRSRLPRLAPEHAGAGRLGAGA